MGAVVRASADPCCEEDRRSKHGQLCVAGGVDRFGLFVNTTTDLVWQEVPQRTPSERKGCSCYTERSSRIFHASAAIITPPLNRGASSCTWKSGLDWLRRAQNKRESQRRAAAAGWLGKDSRRTGLPCHRHLLSAVSHLATRARLLPYTIRVRRFRLQERSKGLFIASVHASTRLLRVRHRHSVAPASTLVAPAACRNIKTTAHSDSASPHRIALRHDIHLPSPHYRAASLVL